MTSTTNNTTCSFCGEDDVTQATMLKRTHEIQCGFCGMTEYAENIGVWNDDGTLQEWGLCGECEESIKQKAVAEAVADYVQNTTPEQFKLDKKEEDIVGCCEKCDLNTE